MVFFNRSKNLLVLSDVDGSVWVTRALAFANGGRISLTVTDIQRSFQLPVRVVSRGRFFFGER